MPLAVLPWVTYLALPVSVHPLLILLPVQRCSRIAVDIASASFKNTSTDHWTGATLRLHRPTGHGDVEVLRAHVLDI